MPSEIWESIKIILSFIFGALGLKIFDKFANKKKENLEHIKLFEEGSNLQIQVRTNIDKVVEAKTRQLNSQIDELKETIVTISSRYRADMDRYIDRMADLEGKFDEQIKRNEEMEDRLTKQIRIREECLEELAEIKERMNKVEEKTS